MKTPKRHHELTTMEHAPSERVWDFSQEQVNAQRWKRKNRVARLKNTIARYKRIEHLPFYSPIWQACRLILDLKSPGKKADLNEYNQYFQQLEEISVQIGREMRRTGIIAGEKLAEVVQKQNNRKERENG